MDPNENAALNTDRELYREPDKGCGSYYSDSIHVTQQGGIGINCGGTVIVMSLKNWHLAAQRFLEPMKSPNATDEQNGA